MAQRKAGEVEAFLSRPDTSFPVVVLYGPDPGLVSERADKVAQLSGVDPSDPFSSVTLQADELERDIGRLFDEARTVSMFGGRRLIRVKGAGNGRNLSDAVADLADNPPEGATVVIEAGDLKKSAGLRLNAERGRGAMALPCYQDEGRSLDRMIDEELGEAGLSIDRAARETLRARLGANRLASRGEVRKLALYALGRRTVTEEDVEAIVGDVSADTVDETVDAAASGEVRLLPGLVERLTGAGTSIFQLQGALLRHFQTLQAMRAEVERGTPVPAVVERRRVHFRRKGAFEAALAAWDGAGIARALRRIEADILLSRKESALADTIMRRMLTEIGVEAARRRRARR
ncbi:DNA polymerase III subunit delta [Aureimonas jatrophae]|uniref:DNA-directed DNA polymerase n=1 Tax=Aureimonas jatrophae TaxID=1166073 RepID=A0A1H0K7E2_9HYPH|nr:DNA polymerase III subunit delta [Aureimonas jatrophae]MBB3950982.1 DNA polymerase-3 subunit delta [Aureimonas jatrophae]SDO51787.1 DNA polymerase III, delta subunit [Aureimonas jatrophae]